MTNTTTISNVNSLLAFYKFLFRAMVFAQKEEQISPSSTPFFDDSSPKLAIQNGFFENLLNAHFIDRSIQKWHEFPTFLHFYGRKMPFFNQKRNKKSFHWKVFLMAISYKFSGSPPDGFCSG